jgi:GNAT superfamily N-acetyltransferase
MDTWRRDRFLVSTDKSLLDVRAVHAFLSQDSYWSKGIPEETVRRGIEHAMVFGMYDTGVVRGDGVPAQVGFARVITDRSTFAYLSDVFVLPAYRGRGLSKWLMEVITGHPELQGLRRWMLLTADAHGLYRQFGFGPSAKPERVMERHDPDVYTRGA